VFQLYAPRNLDVGGLVQADGRGFLAMSIACRTGVNSSHCTASVSESDPHPNKRAPGLGWWSDTLTLAVQSQQHVRRRVG
jgi:hypothetical protein